MGLVVKRDIPETGGLVVTLHSDAGRTGLEPGRAGLTPSPPVPLSVRERGNDGRTRCYSIRLPRAGSFVRTPSLREFNT